MASIKIPPPGQKSKKIIEMDHKYLCNSTKVSPFVAELGKKSTITDIDGNNYIDFTSGISVANIGYQHPQLKSAIIKQLNKLIHFASQDFYNEKQVELAKLLTEISPGKFDKKVFFSNSGTESVEAALKLARSNRKCQQVIAFIGAFHGRTLGALALTASKPIHRRDFMPLLSNVAHVPYGNCYHCKFESPRDCGMYCADFIEDNLFKTFIPPEQVAAIVVEPIQGEGGIIVPPDGFHQRIREICNNHQVPLIVDEIQTGLGRTGKMFAIEHWNVKPDIITLAKSLGGGIPIGATIFNAKFDFKEPGIHSNTFGGNLLACAAGTETIKIIQREKLVENSAKMGEFFMKRLKEFETQFESIGQVRGLGLMMGMEFVKDKNTKLPAPEIPKRIIKIALKNGLILLPAGFSVIRIMPPLIIDEELATAGLNILEDAIKQSL
ncbi:MAG: acetyl ornithine aminotransferase family protein [Candidatus Helarchaeota archaeon]